MDARQRLDAREAAILEHRDATASRAALSAEGAVRAREEGLTEMPIGASGRKKSLHRVKRQHQSRKTMARTIKVYRIADDGRRLASGAFKAASEQDLQLKWELHLATAAGGLYIATHRGVQLGIGFASDAVRHHGGAHG